ncbi:hypothetical protein Hanom_Chr09g00806651 [Helianthus anomalus]
MFSPITYGDSSSLVTTPLRVPYTQGRFLIGLWQGHGLGRFFGRDANFFAFRSNFLYGCTYLHTILPIYTPKKLFFCPYMHTLQCRTVAKTRRFGPVNQTKTDGCLTGLLTGPKRRALAAF